MGVDFYIRFLVEKTDELRAAVNHLILALTGNAADQKLPAAKSTKAAVERLLSGLSAADHPSWTNNLLSALNTYISNSRHPAAGQRLMNAVIAVHPAMQSQTWQALSASDTGLDFESVYERYAAQSRLVELFDGMILKLTEIVDSGHVDSLRIQRALESIVATLRRNRKSSYFSTHSAWQFTKAVFENFLWEALSDVPGIGAAVRAVRTTFDEVEEEMAQIDHSIKVEIVQLAKAQVPMIAPRSEGALPPAPLGEEHVAGESPEA